MSEGGPAKKSARLQEYEGSHRIGEALWKTDVLGTDAMQRTSPGHMYEESFEEHLAALSTSSKEKATTHEAPFDVSRHAAASFNAAGFSTTSLDKVLASITTSSKKPNEEQRRFLAHFVARLKVEWLEKQQGRVNIADEEPLLDVVHGFPGTGR